jgi:hypothetical protein
LAILAVTLTPAHANRLGGNGVAMLSDAITSGGSVSTNFDVTIEDLEDPENSTTTSYQITACVGDIAEAITDTSPANPPLVSGFVGSLFEVTTLTLAASPNTLPAAASSNLVLTAVLHDGSQIVVDPRYAGWQVTGPLDPVAASGPSPATVIAQSVPTQTNASVAATFMKPTAATSAITVLGDGSGIGVDPDWLATHSITTFDPLSDDDKDGIPDIFEAVYNFNPHAPDNQAPYENGIHEESGQEYLKIRFRKNTQNTGIIVTVERGTELSPSNFGPGGVVEVLPRAPIDANTEWVTFRSTTPIGGAHEFLRLKAVYTGAP